MALEQDLEPVCSLEEPTRRRLYEFVVGSAAAVTRDDAAQALDLDRSLVAYHLDKLADAGLLAVSFARPEGRSGPGAGRPAKHYERADREFSVTMPPRDYRLAAELLARAADRDTTGAVRRSLDEAAEELGRDLVADAPPTTGRDLTGYLADQGFEPYHDEGVIRLGNCPFHQLARQHTELVCGMNLTLLASIVDELGGGWNARLDPAPDRCCVAFDPAPGAA